VTHTKVFADFLQLRAAGREETAHQSIPAKLLDLNLPALGATAQPLEYPGQLRRDRCLFLAKCVIACFRSLRDFGGYRIQINDYQRARVKSTNFARAIAVVKSPGDVTGL
jgi:hypothetical protein